MFTGLLRKFIIMKSCHEFLQTILPELGYRWAGFRKVRRQVCRRIHQRMQELGIASYRDYLYYIAQNPGERAILDRSLDITITRFWRDKGVYALLEKTVFPDLIQQVLQEKRTKLRCWSAGCCNGEEPYSLQLLWHIRLSPEDLNLEIIATDWNQAVLDRAQRGCFPEGVLKDLPADLLEKGFERKDAAHVIKDQFKHNIHFLRQDIREEMPGGQFDIILCRNFILTYFDREISVPLLNKFLSLIRKGGYFIIGSTETIPPAFDKLKQIKKGEPVYRLYEE